MRTSEASPMRSSAERPPPADERSRQGAAGPAANRHPGGRTQGIPSGLVEHQPLNEADQREHGVHVSSRPTKDELPALGRGPVLGVDQNTDAGAVDKSQFLQVKQHSRMG